MTDADSPFAPDPALAALSARFAQRLPATLAELAPLSPTSDAGEVKRIAHAVAGSAAMFGFGEIGARARTLCDALAEPSEGDPQGAYDALIAALRAAT